MDRTSGPISETDDTIAAQTEFDIVETTGPVQEVESSVDEQPMPEEIESSQTRHSDCIYLYVIFGVCGLLAFVCYRRGAT